MHDAAPDAIAAILARRAELAAELEALERRATPIRADIFHLDAALAILGGPADARRMRAQHRPAWVANLGRLVLDILRGAPEPMTARAIAVELLRLAGHDSGDKAAVKVVEDRVCLLNLLVLRSGWVQAAGWEGRAWDTWRAG